MKKKSKPVDYEDFLSEQMQEPEYKRAFHVYYARLHFSVSLRGRNKKK